MNLINFLNPTSRKKIGDTTAFNIVPIGFSSTFEEYHALGIQQPRHALTFDQMRTIAEKSVWVEAAIRAITDVIGSLTWQIVPKKQYIYLYEKDEKMQRSKYYLEQLFSLQNATMSTFSEVLKAIVRDMLVMDAGVVEIIRFREDPETLTKETDRKGRMVGFVARDATSFFIDYDEHQIIRRYVQVGMRGRQAMPMAEDNLIFNIDVGGSFAVFDRNDIIYCRMHPKSGSAYGSPPIATLLSSIQADLAADANITRFMATGGIVPGFIAADADLDPNVTKRFEEAFRRIQRAGGREIPIISGAGQTSFIPIAANSREMEQNQLQNYYMKKILALYKVPPSVLGLTDGVNRAVVFAQNDNFMAGAITPFKVYLENIISERIVSEFDHRLRFEFLEPNAADKQSRMEEIQVREQMGMIDDVEKFILAGVEPPQRESRMSVMSDLQEEGAKADLELKKLQIAQAKFQLEQGVENVKAQKEQMSQQQEMQQQQAMQQQKMAERQQMSDMGGMRPFDAMEESQKYQQQAMQKSMSPWGPRGNAEEIRNTYGPASGSSMVNMGAVTDQVKDNNKPGAAIRNVVKMMTGSGGLSASDELATTQERPAISPEEAGLTTKPFRLGPVPTNAVKNKFIAGKRMVTPAGADANRKYVEKNTEAREKSYSDVSGTTSRGLKDLIDGR